MSLLTCQSISILCTLA